ncbi:MAG: lysophospholipid acyltransferase family protein [Gammaproteobacteria bacterium]|nr:lysophospholipid acyltransferase family protein [Gammaproteobacteria bacterium]
MNSFPVTSYLSPRYWPTWAGLALLRLLSMLPLPAIAVLGQGLGMLAYCLIGSRRRIALRNISVCFPEWTLAKCRMINRQHFRLVGQTLFTTPMNMWVSESRFDRLVEITGRQHYDAALAAGRNIILLAPHFIGIDVSGLALSRERTIVSMYQYAKNALVDEISKRGRSRYGGLLIERKEPLRKVLRLISQGDPLYYLPDQDAGRKGIFVPFFHQQASTTPALAKFAGAAQAVIIPCRTRIKPRGQGYEVILGEPLVDFPSGDDYTDTARMNQLIAAMIRNTPEQYFWVHKRFKTRPKDESAPFYEFL